VPGKLGGLLLACIEHSKGGRQGEARKAGRWWAEQGLAPRRAGQQSPGMHSLGLKLAGLQYCASKAATAASACAPAWAYAAVRVLCRVLRPVCMPVKVVWTAAPFCVIALRTAAARDKDGAV
jgi:hypothetical protein